MAESFVAEGRVRLHQDIKPDRISIPQSDLDIDEKYRSSPLPWKGQFSPQFAEAVLKYYKAEGEQTLFDPFCGSGTALFEGVRTGYNVIGADINPAAYIMSELVKLCSLKPESRPGSSNGLFGQALIDLHLQEIYDRNCYLLREREKNILKATKNLDSFIQDLPTTNKKISVLKRDARDTGMRENEVDIVFTSPPYINVFNYHQNQRSAVESLGFNVLSIAKSEIGSNRANRANRFLTVIQYCLDMTLVISEIQRVVKDGGDIIFVMGRESNVMGVRFENGQIIFDLFTAIFDFVLESYRERKFLNRYGQIIYEDILHFKNRSSDISKEKSLEIANSIAVKHLKDSFERTKLYSGDPIVLNDLAEAILKAQNVMPTPLAKGEI